MSNYPPGVTGNEPQITGEWPCRACGGEGGFRDEETPSSCYWCKGTGIEPEEYDADQLWGLAVYYDREEARKLVAEMAEQSMRWHPETRKYLRRCIAAVSDRRW